MRGAFALHTAVVPSHFSENKQHACTEDTTDPCTTVVAIGGNLRTFAKVRLIQIPTECDPNCRYTRGVWMKPLILLGVPRLTLSIDRFVEG